MNREELSFDERLILAARRTGREGQILIDLIVSSGMPGNVVEALGKLSEDEIQSVIEFMYDLRSRREAVENPEPQIPDLPPVQPLPTAAGSD